MLRKLKSILNYYDLSTEEVDDIEELIEVVLRGTKEKLLEKSNKYGEEGMYEKAKEVFDSLIVIDSMINGNYTTDEKNNAEGFFNYPIPLELKTTSSCKLEAFGEIYEDNRVILKKGSQISKTEKVYIGAKCRTERSRLIDENLVENKGEYFELITDVEYNSPSAAASVVTGASEGGWSKWIVRGTTKEIGEFIGRETKKQDKIQGRKEK